jgi:hypothetical protein
MMLAVKSVLVMSLTLHQTIYDKRRRLNRLYDPEVQRHALMNNLFDISCSQCWPRATLYTTEYLFDSFVVDRDIALESLSFCGMAALALTSKIEAELDQETGTRNLMDDLELPQDSRNIVSQIERTMLGFFGFGQWINHPYYLLDCLRNNLGLGSIILCDFVRFLTDVCAMDDRSIDERPSCIVAASLYLSLKILNMKWNGSISRLTGFSPDELRAPVDALVDSLLRLNPESALFREWYRDRTYYNDGGVPAFELDTIGGQRRRRVHGPENYIPANIFYSGFASIAFNLFFFHVNLFYYFYFYYSLYIIPSIP